MSRSKQYLLLLVGLAVIGLVLYGAYRSRPQPGPRAPLTARAGLSWLPAEASLVAEANVAELRQQRWLLDLVAQAAGEVREDAEHAAFVEATDFDYTRDLDHLWIATFGTAEQAPQAGVAEGRFASAAIMDYARRQGASVRRHEGFDVYELRMNSPAPGQPQATPSERRFAIAFLDDSHLAFGSSAEQARRVIDCWLGRAPAVDSDEARRAELLRLAAGWQLWVVDSSGRWQSLIPGSQQSQSDLGAVVAQMALGLRVGEQGVEVGVEARCQEAAQAKRLRDNLGLMMVVGQIAMARQEDAVAQALGEALKNVSITQSGEVVEARLLLAPVTVQTLLRAQPAASRR
jgi:hypothetical protein